MNIYHIFEINSLKYTCSMSHIEFLCSSMELSLHRQLESKDFPRVTLMLGRSKDQAPPNHLNTTRKMLQHGKNPNFTKDKIKFKTCCVNYRNQFNHKVKKCFAYKYWYYELEGIGDTPHHSFLWCKIPSKNTTNVLAVKIFAVSSNYGR